MERSGRFVSAPVGVVLLFAFLMASGCAQEEPDRTSISGKGRERTGTTGLQMADGTGTQQQEVPAPYSGPITEERTFYDFERGNLAGWEVPQWAIGKNDYVAVSTEVSSEVASKGTHSMKVSADFPGGYWTAALVEIQQYLDLSKYRVISADVYLPPGAPMGLNAGIIITIGDNWRFVEMNRSFPLLPGEWITVTAGIEPGSYDWKRIIPDEKFVSDLRKIAVRIESNNKPKYKGDIFIDNIRVGR
ncbi:MAG: hypothetical protein WCV56_04990 [Candidatus Omnitrophota bacterium]